MTGWKLAGFGISHWTSTGAPCPLPANQTVKQRSSPVNFIQTLVCLAPTLEAAKPGSITLLADQRASVGAGLQPDLSRFPGVDSLLGVLGPVDQERRSIDAPSLLPCSHVTPAS